MPDKKKTTDYRDSTRINTNQTHEVKYWTRKWNISPQQLTGAIRAADSTSVKKVEKYLKDNDKI